MACPFLENPVDIGARIIRQALQRERVIRPRNDIFAQEACLHERYRFSKQSIVYINNLLKPYISSVTHRGFALTSLETLCIALRFYANGSFLYSIGDAEHISKATVCRCIRRVSLALKRFLHVFVVFPGHKTVRNIKEEFYKIAGFPRVIGSIDTTQIPIKAPSVNEGHYLNRKSFHSINVQIICDASHLISNVEAKWPGSVDKSRIFQESTLFHMCERGEFDGVLLGDRGYPCLRFLMTPYPAHEAGPQQARFNEAHRRTRAGVGTTIAILKARFQCLRGLRVSPERACDIIVACAVLHNLAIMRGERLPTIEAPAAEDDDPIHRIQDDPEGRGIRDSISQGEWQYPLGGTVSQ
ncbi:putative nuclease HARBI1 isoform X2 [Anguilla anguilla]|uniref:putative nuclease HARBI1 isoform X2 n=1 Tax=Anguilla anguilla TaxID=7936 RepID=UPI0015AFBCEA|nr:putative nuclease HARBI1 isoform X2 [Anguilla anguilla]